MKCPFTVVKGNICSNHICVFSSRINESNCFYGESLDINNIAKHKSMTTRQVRFLLGEIDDKIKYSIKLYKYAEFCSDEEPNEKDLIIYENVKRFKPYNTKLFSFVTLKRFARMNRIEAFERFKANGIQIEENLTNFLLKPMSFYAMKGIENGKS